MLENYTLERRLSLIRPDISKRVADDAATLAMARDLLLDCDGGRWLLGKMKLQYEFHPERYAEPLDAELHLQRLRDARRDQIEADEIILALSSPTTLAAFLRINADAIRGSAPPSKVAIGPPINIDALSSDELDLLTRIENPLAAWAEMTASNIASRWIRTLAIAASIALVVGLVVVMVVSSTGQNPSPNPIATPDPPPKYEPRMVDANALPAGQTVAGVRDTTAPIVGRILAATGKAKIVAAGHLDGTPIFVQWPAEAGEWLRVGDRLSCADADSARVLLAGSAASPDSMLQSIIVDAGDTHTITGAKSLADSTAPLDREWIDAIETFGRTESPPPSVARGAGADPVFLYPSKLTANPTPPMIVLLRASPTTKISTIYLYFGTPERRAPRVQINVTPSMSRDLLAINWPTEWIHFPVGETDGRIRIELFDANAGEIAGETSLIVKLVPTDSASAAQTLISHIDRVRARWAPESSATWRRELARLRASVFESVDANGDALVSLLGDLSAVEIAADSAATAQRDRLATAMNLKTGEIEFVRRGIEELKK